MDRSGAMLEDGIDRVPGEESTASFSLEQSNASGDGGSSEFAPSPGPFELEPHRGPQSITSAGSTSSSELGVGDGHMSAAMNLQEYEARFVHRRLATPQQGGHDSFDIALPRGSLPHVPPLQPVVVHSPGRFSPEFSMEDSQFSDGRDDSHLNDHGAARVMAHAVLVDPVTGQPYSPSVAVANIRAQIAAAEAQALASAPNAEEISTPAQSFLGSTRGESESERDSACRRSSPEEFGTASDSLEDTSSPSSRQHQLDLRPGYETCRDVDLGSETDSGGTVLLTHRSAVSNASSLGISELVREGQQLLEALDSAGADHVVGALLNGDSALCGLVRKKQQELRAMGRHEGMRKLIAEGEKLMDILPENQYHDLSSVVVKSSQPTAVALRANVLIQLHSQTGERTITSDDDIFRASSPSEWKEENKSAQAQASDGQDCPATSDTSDAAPQVNALLHGDESVVAAKLRPNPDEQANERVRLTIPYTQAAGPNAADVSASNKTLLEAASAHVLHGSQKFSSESDRSFAPCGKQLVRTLTESATVLDCQNSRHQCGSAEQIKDFGTLGTGMDDVVAHDEKLVVQMEGMGSNVYALRQARAMQTRRHISDIFERIHGMQANLQRSLEDDVMSVFTHVRLSQQFDVVDRKIQRLGRQLHSSRNLSLVMRDKHDDNLRLEAVECLAIIKESKTETHNALKQLHSTLIETQQRLADIEDEVVRIAEGTVLVGHADCSEWQPVFDHLHLRWQIEKGSCGKAFKSWRSLWQEKREEREKIRLEQIIIKLQVKQTCSMTKMWALWRKACNRKRRNASIGLSRKQIGLFSVKVWAFYSMHAEVRTNRRAHQFSCGLKRRCLGQLLLFWQGQTIMRKLSDRRDEKARRMLYQNVGGLVIRAWHYTIVRKNRMQRGLRWQIEKKRCKVLIKAIGCWLTFKATSHYQSAQLHLRERMRTAELIQTWHVATRALRKRRHRINLHEWRQRFERRNSFFQLWCEGIEGEIIKKIKIDKVFSQNRVRLQRGNFFRWARVAHVHEKGVLNFKTRRIFKSLKRYIFLVAAERKMRTRWRTLNRHILVGNVFEKLSDYCHDLRLGMGKLRAICEAQGGIDLSTAFDRWRLREIKTRLWRYQRRHLAKRNRSNLKHWVWRQWLLSALGKESIDKASQHAIRMGLARRKRHILVKTLRVFSNYLTYMSAKTRKEMQVRKASRRHKLAVAWNIWMRLLAFVRRLSVVRRKQLVRFKRRSLRQMYNNVAHRVQRMLFGAWCGECKRPFNKKELHDHAARDLCSEGDGARLNSMEKAILVAKKERHGIRHMLQKAYRSSPEVEEGSATSSRERLGEYDGRSETSLLEEYLHEVNAARQMLETGNDAPPISAPQQSVKAAGDGRDSLTFSTGHAPQKRGRPEDCGVSFVPQVKLAWQQLRHELLSTHQDLLAVKDDGKKPAEQGPGFGAVVYKGSIAEQRVSLDAENIAPANSWGGQGATLQRNVLDALELAQEELAMPRLPVIRSDVARHEHQVVADIHTAATVHGSGWYRNEHYQPNAAFVENFSKQLRNEMPLFAHPPPPKAGKKPRPPSAAKPSHLNSAGLGFQPLYRVKRPGIDPTLLAGGGWLSKQESPLLQDPRA